MLKRISFTKVSRRAFSIAVQQQAHVRKSFEEQMITFNDEVEPLLNDPIEVLKWSMSKFNGQLAMSTSFGIQSAMLLHLATRAKPDIPVIWVDTGYLPKETYEYAEILKETLDLNVVLKTNAEWTPARMEAKYGNLWETDHKLYGRMRKLEPLVKGIYDLKPSPLAMLSGLRASQTDARANMQPVGMQHDRVKVLPILKVTDEEVEAYFDKYDLPRHPLESKGYVTVGDWHSSRPVSTGENARDTRFGGKFQECGLHVEEDVKPKNPVKNFDSKENQLQSFAKTNVKALLDTKANKDTETAVILVKKITEDGSFCRKCNDVQAKLQKDGVEKWIGNTIYADVRDSQTEGIKLAKHFAINTAPFFLVRTKEEEINGEEWKVVSTYLPLKKLLQKRAKNLEAAKASV